MASDDVEVTWLLLTWMATIIYLRKEPMVLGKVLSRFREASSGTLDTVLKPR